MMVAVRVPQHLAHLLEGIIFHDTREKGQQKDAVHRYSQEEKAKAPQPWPALSFRFPVQYSSVRNAKAAFQSRIKQAKPAQQRCNISRPPKGIENSLISRSRKKGKQRRAQKCQPVFLPVFFPYTPKQQVKDSQQKENADRLRCVFQPKHTLPKKTDGRQQQNASRKQLGKNLPVLSPPVRQVPDQFPQKKSPGKNDDNICGKNSGRP